MDVDSDDFGGLSAARFFRLAERLPAYAGVMQALVIAEQQESEGMGPGNDQPSVTDRPVPATRNNGGTHYEDGRPVGPNARSMPTAVPLTPEMVAGGVLSGVFGNSDENQALGGLLEHRHAPAL